MTTSVWTADLIARRRHLHARIDAIAGPSPAAAARLRLDLYTVTHEAETGAIDRELLTLQLDDLELRLDEVAGSCVRVA